MTDKPYTDEELASLPDWLGGAIPLSAVRPVIRRLLATIAARDREMDEAVSQCAIWKDASLAADATILGLRTSLDDAERTIARLTPLGLCVWTQNPDDESDSWMTNCGEMFCFIDGDPTENGVRFCHGCGKPVEVVPWVMEPDDDDDDDPGVIPLMPPLITDLGNSEP